MLPYAPICLSSQLTGWLSRHVYPVERGHTVQERVVMRCGRIVSVSLTAPLLFVVARVEFLVYTILNGIVAAFYIVEPRFINRSFPGLCDGLLHSLTCLKHSAQVAVYWNMYNFTLSFRGVFLGSRTFDHESLALRYGTEHIGFNSFVKSVASITLLFFESFISGILLNNSPPYLFLFTPLTISFMSESFTPRRLPRAVEHSPTQRLLDFDVEVAALPREPTSKEERILKKRTLLGLNFLKTYYTEDAIASNRYGMVIEQAPAATQFVAERCVYLLSIPLAKEQISIFLQPNTIELLKIFRAMLACGKEIVLPLSVKEIPTQWNSSAKNAIDKFLSDLNAQDISSSPFQKQLDEIRNLFYILQPNIYNPTLLSSTQLTQQQDLIQQIHFLLVTWRELTQSDELLKQEHFNALDQFFGKHYPIEDLVEEEHSTSIILTSEERPTLPKRMRQQIQMIANLEWRDFSKCILTKSSLKEFISLQNAQ